MIIFILCIVIIIVLFAYQKASDKVIANEIDSKKYKSRIKDLENLQNDKIKQKYDLVLTTIQNLNKYSSLKFSSHINKPNLLQGKLMLETKRYDCLFSIFQNYINLQISNKSDQVENDFLDKDYHFYYTNDDPTSEKLLRDIIIFLEIRNNVNIDLRQINKDI
ncbi:hypothetical protein ABEG63_14850 [Chryseobacterium sp. C39-AII1]|uniref:hypothetical protein n=1 Tax=Chryseobacterium sp. C39-AII1 TaxID=3080332 RepID=UPI00320B8C9D